jgi:hypothetical protein
LAFSTQFPANDFPRDFRQTAVTLLFVTWDKSFLQLLLPRSKCEAVILSKFIFSSFYISTFCSQIPQRLTPELTGAENTAEAIQVVDNREATSASG